MKLELKTKHINIPRFKYCSGAGMSDYIFVDLNIPANLEFNEKTYYFSFQNGHTFRGNSYNCPVNEFTVYDDNGFIDTVMRSEDIDDVLQVKRDFDLACTPEQILELKTYIENNTPTLQQLGYSESTEDYMFFDDSGKEVEGWEYHKNGGTISQKSLF